MSTLFKIGDRVVFDDEKGTITAVSIAYKKKVNSKNE